MSTWRRDNITRYIYGWAKGVLPSLSATEREAIEAGDVWWDAEIFTGNPGLVETARDAASNALGRGTGVPRRPGRGTLPPARRMAHHLGSA